MMPSNQTVGDAGEESDMQLNCETLSREARNNLEMLQWMSERNAHVPVGDLAFLLDIPEHEKLQNDMADFDYPYDA